MDLLIVLAFLSILVFLVINEIVFKKQLEKKLKDSFITIAYEALNSNNKLFLDLAEQKFQTLKVETQKDFDQKEQNFSNLIKPLSTMIEDYKKIVEELEIENIKTLTTMSTSISSLSDQATKLSLETSKLNNVLGTAKQRGRWGEITLKKILELAGLNSFTDFSEQNSDESGNKPDFVIKLPNRRNIIIDSKFNADSYIRALEASSEEDRNKYLKAHSKAVLETCKDLAKKKYHESAEYSADFVVMFVPNDSVLASAVEQDSNLLEQAMSLKIVIATPSTLYAMLKVVALGWQEFEFNQNAKKVKELGSELFKRTRTLTSHFNELNIALKRSVKAYNSIIGSFETNFLSQLNKFKEYGVTSDELISEGAILEDIRDLNQDSKYLSDNSDANSQKSVGPADLP